jgi:hypothetical protein
MLRGRSVTVVNCHRGRNVGGRMVWVGMLRGRFVGGRNVKVPFRTTESLAWASGNNSYSLPFSN